ncbi:MAG: ribosomal protein L7/L12 [Myxococcota bacterium]
MRCCGAASGSRCRGTDPPTRRRPRSVESLIRAGRKIEAIKRLREETGLGLKEAKEEVERRQRQL